MEHNFDHILNPVPHKSIYLCQIGEKDKENFALGLALDHEGWQKIQKQFQGKISKILLRRTSEAQYNLFRHKVNTVGKNEVVSNIYHLLSNSVLTNHMN